MNPIRAWNGVADWWAHWALTGLVESAVLLAIVGAILFVGRRRIPAAAATWMLLLVLVKGALPLGFEMPLAQSWQLATEETTAVHAEAASKAVRKSDAVSPALISEPLAKAPAGTPVNSHVPPATRASEPARTNHADVVIEVKRERETLSWQSLALMAWLSVVVALLLRMVSGHVRLGRALRFAEPLDLSGLGIHLAELAAKLEIGRPLRAVRGPEHVAPAVSGVWRPTLVLPRGIESQLTADQLRWVILHELAHVRRGDLPVSFVARLVRIGTFFNPATWIAARMAEHHRECACDALAMRHAGCDRLRCGEAFLSILSTMVTARQPALAFFSTRRLARRRFVRLLDTRQDGGRRARWPVAVAVAAVLTCAMVNVSQKRGAAVAVAAVTADSVASDTASAEKPGGEAKRSAAVSKEPDAQLVKTVEGIWDQQMRVASPTSVKVRYRQLRLSKYNPDPLQQGHDLVDLSWKEAVNILESIDLVNDPRALRKVRDRFLTEGLILDQPAANEILFQRDGDKLRIDLDGGEYLVLVGNTAIHHRPRERLVKIGRGFYVEEARHILADSELRWSFIRLPVNTLQFWGDRKPKRALTLADGSSRIGFGRVVMQRTSSESIPNQLSLLWHVNADGLLNRVDSAGDQEWSRELEFKEYPGGGFLPKVRIDTSPIGSNDPTLKVVRELTISIIEEAEFNMPIPPETFKAAVPANTAVWDRRRELKLRAAETPVRDVLTLFER